MRLSRGIRVTKKIRKNLLADWKEYDKLCEEGKVPSGGWCKRCERYDCGRLDHYR